MGHRTSDIGYHRHWTLDIGHRTSTSTSTSDIGHRTSDIGYKLLHFWWFPGLVKKTLWRHDRPYLRLQNPPLLVFFFLQKRLFWNKILHFWCFFFSKSSTFGYENLKNLHFFFFFCLKMDFSSKPPLPSSSFLFLLLPS